MKLLKVLGQELKIKMSPTFMQNAACPQYLKFHYVDKVAEEKRWVRIEAERGKVVHAAIADLLKYCIDQRIEVQQLDDATLREAIQKHLPHSILNEVGLIFQWTRLWRDRFKLPNNIVGIEEKVALDDEFEESAWDNASYRGILDLMQATGSHGVVTDWKSQPHIVAESELHVPIGNDIAEQFTHYCWLAWKMYPQLETFSARLWYLRYGFYVETQRTLEDLELFEHALMIKERKIAQIENWDPIPGRHCQYCAYIHMCPIAQDMSPTNAEVITQEQAIRAAQRVTVYEAMTKELKGKLKTYVNNNDNVVIGDKWVYGYNHKTSTSWDPEKVDEVLSEHNRSLTEVVNVDVKKMRKTIKEATKTTPALASELEHIAKEKHKTEFSGFLKGDKGDQADDSE